MKKYLSLIAVIFIIASCSSSKKTSQTTPDLFQKWNLRVLNGDSVLSFGKRPTITFDESSKKIFGVGGCNNFFGTFRKKGNKISFSQIGSTRMACLNNEQLESKYFAALEKVDNYEFENDNLLLKDGNKTIAAFTVSNAAPDELAGKWELNYITGRRISFQGLYPDRKPTITFKENSDEVSVFTGCNALTAEYTSKKGPLFDPGAMTLMSCPGEGEQAFLDQFKKVGRYTLKDGTLTFYYKDVPAMKFVKQKIQDL